MPVRGDAFVTGTVEHIMKYISLFAGIGGFDLALNRLGYECVYANDFDKYAKITYDKNFTHKLDGKSITEVREQDIPTHDLLVGGFPCQAFSIAGKRRGFEDTRGTLFFDVARILKYHKPRYFILENVKGLLSHDNGSTFKTIIATIDELGYDCQWQVLNSKNFGVPQNRERVFIVGHIRGESRPEIFPIRENDGLHHEASESNGSRTQTANSATIRSNYWKGQADGQYINVIADLTGEKWDRFNESSRRIYSTDGIAPTVPTSAGGGHIPKIYAVAQRGRYEPDGSIKQQLEPRYDGVTNTLTGVEKDNRLFVAGNIRRLTPKECERLQGFPDNWTAGVSDTQRYKQLGNAVTVNVIYEVAKRLIERRII